MAASATIEASTTTDDKMAALRDALTNARAAITKPDMERPGVARRAAALDDLIADLDSEHTRQLVPEPGTPALDAPSKPAKRAKKAARRED